MEKEKEIEKYSNLEKIIKNAKNYLGNDIPIYLSSRKDKKFMIKPFNRWVHFGQMGYQDFTKHKNIIRKHNYLNRSQNIKGDWKNDKYSPNNLSINILWK